VIAYFDTSAIVPLLVDEPGTDDALEIWNGADHTVSCTLVYPEARAAVAHAQRQNRIDADQGRVAIRRLDDLVGVLDLVTLDDDLALVAGVLAEREALRGADAVHLAAALSGGPDLAILVAGDRHLLAAGERQGLATHPLP
jgi:predicted nucleic acid-binding protein